MGIKDQLGENTMTKQAIIYTRFSPRPSARECDSCEKQVERCEAYCRQRGYNVFAVTSDPNVTGGELNRPGLSEAMGLLASHCRYLVVDSSDRLARDMLVNLTIRHQVEQAGATIEYANGSPCEDTPEGRLFQNMLAAFAAYERDRIRLRTKNGLERKRKNGERTTGKIPIGWKKDPEDPKRLVVCEVERRAIVAACSFKREGLSSEEIAAELDYNLGPCRGNSWSARTVRKLIKRHAFWADPVDGDPALEPLHP